MYLIRIKTYTEFGFLANLHVCPYNLKPGELAAYHELADTPPKLFDDLEEATKLAENIGIKMQMPPKPTNHFANPLDMTEDVLPELEFLCDTIFERQLELIGEMSKYFNRLKTNMQHNDYDVRRAAHLPIPYMTRMPWDMTPQEQAKHEVRPALDHPPITVIEVVPYVAPLMKPIIIRVA